jgi:hypothetical protein
VVFPDLGPVNSFTIPAIVGSAGVLPGKMMNVRLIRQVENIGYIDVKLSTVFSDREALGLAPSRPTIFCGFIR